MSRVASASGHRFFALWRRRADVVASLRQTTNLENLLGGKACCAPYCYWLQPLPPRGWPRVGAARKRPNVAAPQFRRRGRNRRYDCHASQTFALLHPVTPQYSLLVRWDATENSKIVGDLAKSWTIAPDGLTYTFTLHDGIKFHDGSPLTSADIKATFERIATPPEGVVSVRKERFADVAAIETPDSGDRRVQAEGGQRLLHGAAGLALQLRLQRRQAQSRTRNTPRRRSWARAPSSSSSTCADRTG